MAQRLLLKKHNIEYTKKIPNKRHQILNIFKGLTMEQIEKLAKKHHLNIDIYEYITTESNNYYDISEQWFFDKSYPTHSALLYTNDHVIHIIYVKEPENLTQIHICLKCHSYTFQCPKNLFRFESHVKHCDGIFKKNFIPNKEPLLYCPHILNNPVYEYCLKLTIQSYTST